MTGLCLDGASVVVAGLGVSGRAAAEALRAAGAGVLTVDAAQADADLTDPAAVDLAGVDLVVASPGWRPGSGLLPAAQAAGVPVWSEIELAWHLRSDRGGRGPAPWLAVTGTNGKTTTVGMLTSILTAAGERAAAIGNVGTPAVQAVRDGAWQVFAVELSSFQLHATHSMAAQAAACLNVAPDHLDWHGSMAAYTAAKAKVFAGAAVACVYNAADPVTEDLVRAADVAPGCVAVGFTRTAPSVGQLGVVDGVLCDRAFAPDRWTRAVELAELADLDHLAGPHGTLAPHVVDNALAAAALALAHGVAPSAVRDGLRGYPLGEHRIATVAEIGGVGYVDDSKATNAHAAAASLASFAAGTVVWIAGGLAKGADFDELVATRADRLAAAVLIGVDAEPLAGALRRHAPQVPAVRIDPGDTGTVMRRAVHQAGAMARPGDTVLLAPACASMDQFASYADRGAAFAAAVQELASSRARHGAGPR